MHKLVCLIVSHKSHRLSLVFFIFISLLSFDWIFSIDLSLRLLLLSSAWSNLLIKFSIKFFLFKYCILLLQKFVCCFFLWSLYIFLISHLFPVLFSWFHAFFYLCSLIYKKNWIIFKAFHRIIYYISLGSVIRTSFFPLVVSYFPDFLKSWWPCIIVCTFEEEMVSSCLWRLLEEKFSVSQPSQGFWAGQLVRYLGGSAAGVCGIPSEICVLVVESPCTLYFCS